MSQVNEILQKFDEFETSSYKHNALAIYTVFLLVLTFQHMQSISSMSEHSYTIPFQFQIPSDGYLTKHLTYIWRILIIFYNIILYRQCRLSQMSKPGEMWSGNEY